MLPTVYFVLTPPPLCHSHVRYEILEDLANWVTIDKKTGQVKTVKPMDRESPFLNGTNTYTILVGAIDNGKRRQRRKIHFKTCDLVIGEAEVVFVALLLQISCKLRCATRNGNVHCADSRGRHQRQLATFGKQRCRDVR